MMHCVYIDAIEYLYLPPAKLVGKVLPLLLIHLRRFADPAPRAGGQQASSSGPTSSTGMNTTAILGKITAMTALCRASRVANVKEKGQMAQQSSPFKCVHFLKPKPNRPPTFKHKVPSIAQ